MVFSLTAETRAAVATSRAAPATLATRSRVTLILAVLAAALTFLQARAEFDGTWHGGFVDPDDALRLVEVRALLHGQGWFDMTAAGLDPPRGVFMHWSRVVDAPLAALIAAFGFVTDAATAERLARLVFPFLLLVGLYRAVAAVGALLTGAEARLSAMGAVLLSGNGTLVFAPGRIGHHAPGVLALVAMVAALLAALEPARARWAALAGALGALALATSLENLPFVAGLAALLVLDWVWRGEATRWALAWFALGLGLALPLVFAATIAPARSLAPVCDALGPAHLGAGVLGALGCGIAALATARLEARAARLAAALGIAAAATLFVASAYPACLGDPFGGVDPLARALWLANVQESFSLPRMLREDRRAALTAVIPVTLGLCGLALAAWRTSGLARRRHLLVAGVVALGLALTFWQVRVFTSFTALATTGGLFWMVVARRACHERGWSSLASLSPLVLFPFTAAAWALVLPADSAPALQPNAAASVTFADCLAPGAFAPLKSLPPGRVVAPVDAGSFILEAAGLPVFAAPYHRDNDGIRFALDLMMATPEAAARLAARRDVAYVMVCPGLDETRRLAARAPGGLAAALLLGEAPPWLEPVATPGTPYIVFATRPRPNAAVASPR